uniref:G_PROTEIN_RECEP_F1_2 domain-containing protein n=1 Tax=Steinernema glaseri TaxID=37863 RepID=A0A1I7YK95_9BILA
MLIALDRCLLITRPFSFQVIFSRRNTALFIAVSWILSLAAVLAALYFPCNEEHKEGSLFSMEPSMHCNYIFIVFTYGPMWLAIVTTLLVDVYSIWSLHKMNKVRDQLSAQDWSPVYKRKILKLCYMLALQCFVNPLIMFIVTIGDDVESPILSFLVTIFLLSIADSIDGAIVIAFNHDLQTMKNTIGSPASKCVSTRGSAVKASSNGV